jgi:hypothetical protein
MTLQTRYTSCPKCWGSRQERCTSCMSGRVSCTSCSGGKRWLNTGWGEGHYEACSNCQGSGYKSCYSCNGSGNSSCRKCSGSGQIREYIQVDDAGNATTMSGNPTSTCFPAYSKVRTPYGLRRIDSLNVGDKIMSWQPRTGHLIVRSIKAVHSHGLAGIIDIAFTHSGSILSTTANHTVLIPTAADADSPAIPNRAKI